MVSESLWVRVPVKPCSFSLPVTFHMSLNRPPEEKVSGFGMISMQVSISVSYSEFQVSIDATALNGEGPIRLTYVVQYYLGVLSVQDCFSKRTGAHSYVPFQYFTSCK